MKLTPEERTKKREQFAQLSPGKKAEHIWGYYRWFILLALIAVVILGSAIHRAFTKKEPVLYVAYLNTAVGEDLESRLTNDYFSGAGRDPRKEEILFYRDLYLSNNPSAANHEYAYTSGLKVLATINSKNMDIVLMNREAYDLCSGSGYLLDLTDLFPDLPFLISNLVVLEDNAIECSLDETLEYVAITEQQTNALELTQLPAFSQAGFTGEVYLGIIANTPRLDTCVEYIEFLTEYQHLG